MNAILQAVSAALPQGGEGTVVPVAATPAPVDGGSMQWLVGLLLVMSVAPFLITMVTSFAKLAIVGGLLRQALGAPQTPPTAVITGLAAVLTIHVMAPVAIEVQRNLAAHGNDLTPRLVIEAAGPPLRAFLERHATEANVALFRQLGTQLDPTRRTAGNEEGVEQSPAPPALPELETLTVFAPAFVLTELSEAFQIGVFLFLPFLVIDLLVGNVLQALGMMMMSPLAVSLPFKLLLFVSVDGWRLVLQNVLLGYAS